MGLAQGGLPLRIGRAIKIINTTSANVIWSHIWSHTQHSSSVKRSDPERSGLVPKAEKHVLFLLKKTFP